MRILVTGASGYLGGAVCPALAAAGHTVRAAVRPAGRRPPAAAAEVVQADVVGGHGLERACEGCAAVVHLVGALRGTAHELEAVHVRGTEHLLRAAERAGVRRLVHVSAVGARPDAPGPYGRTKWRAEEAVRGGRIPYTILRPTVVFGPGGPGPSFVRSLQRLLRSAPVVAVPGSGQYLLQPVSSADVARACVRAIELPAAVGRTYDLGGPERLTFLEILRRIAASADRPLRPLHVPVGLLRALLPLLGRVPGFPLTRETLAMLLEGNVCDPSAAVADLGLSLEPFRGQ